MNYHTTNWILSKMNEHLDEIKNIYPEHQMLGLFYQGSANYGLDTPTSDVDTKYLIFPNLRDLAMGRKQISNTHVRANEEHTDVKDVRHYLSTFRSQNINFMEILYTPYYIINPEYKDLWAELTEHRDEITHYYPMRAVMSMVGQAEDKYKAMYRESEAKVEKLAKYGYDPKELCHLMRFCFFLEKYIRGASYQDCLILPDSIRSELIQVKQGCWSEPEAKTMREYYINRIHDLRDEFFANATQTELESSVAVDEFLIDWQLRAMTRALQKEFN